MTNDERILALKKQIDEKKNNITNKKKAFVPHTNLVCYWRGENKNLNVLNINSLLMLGWELSSFSEYCKSSGFDKIEVSGYPIADWLEDINQKISLIAIRKEEDELKKMENKLDKLLSEDKKTELELDSIEALLK